MPLVEETAAQAVALGYVADHTRADKVKFKSYVAGHQCSSCALYQGKAGDTEALARCFRASMWPLQAGATPGEEGLTTVAALAAWLGIGGGASLGLNPEAHLGFF